MQVDYLTAMIIKSIENSKILKVSLNPVESAFL